MIIIPGDPEVHFAGVVVLNAITMKEIGRAEFDLVGPAAKPLHGCFSPHKGNETYEVCCDDPTKIKPWGYHCYEAY